MSRQPLTPNQIIQAAVQRLAQSGTPDLLAMLRAQAEGAVGALRDLEAIEYTAYRQALDTIETTADARSASLAGGAQ